MIYKALGQAERISSGQKFSKKASENTALSALLGNFARIKSSAKAGLRQNPGRERGKIGVSEFGRINPSVPKGGQRRRSDRYFLRNYRCFAVFKAAIFGAGAVIFGTVGLTKTRQRGISSAAAGAARPSLSISKTRVFAPFATRVKADLRKLSKSRAF